MPELPEVETIRRQLAPIIEGSRIAGVVVSDAKWVAPASPRAFADQLSGRTVTRLERRGKYFVTRLDDGSALVMHLRMTGNLLYIAENATQPERYLRGLLRIETLDGMAIGSIAFTDPRRFGTAEIISGEEALDRYFAGRLGPEPFASEFDGAYLHARSRGRRTPIKALLLDQRVVAGVGNIYADEALFRSRLAPARRSDRLTRAQAEELTKAVREVLLAGIESNGASFRDLRDVYGNKGSFQDQFLVHRREGLPCPACGAAVIKTRCAGRGTYYCKICQKR